MAWSRSRARSRASTMRHAALTIWVGRVRSRRVVQECIVKEQAGAEEAVLSLVVGSVGTRSRVSLHGRQDRTHIRLRPSKHAPINVSTQTFRCTHTHAASSASRRHSTLSSAWLMLPGCACAPFMAARLCKCAILALRARPILTARARINTACSHPNCCLAMLAPCASEIVSLPLERCVYVHLARTLHAQPGHVRAQRPTALRRLLRTHECPSQASPARTQYLFCFSASAVVSVGDAGSRFRTCLCLCVWPPFRSLPE